MLASNSAENKSIAVAPQSTIVQGFERIDHLLRALDDDIDQAFASNDRLTVKLSPVLANSHQGNEGELTTAPPDNFGESAFSAHLTLLAAKIANARTRLSDLRHLQGELLERIEL